MRISLLSLWIALPAFLLGQTKVLIESPFLSLEQNTEKLFYYQASWSYGFSSWSEGWMPRFLGTGNIEKVETLIPVALTAVTSLFFKVERKEALSPFDPQNHYPIGKIIYTPHYPSDLRRDGVEGEVNLLFTISADGTVQDVEIESSTDERFSEEVLLVISHWEFIPYTVAGNAVAARVTQRIPFRIR